MIKQGLVLTCTKCSTKNFLDPYPFWNFSGNTKCAGCDTLYAVTFVKGQQVSGPTVGSGKADLLPGYAEDKSGTAVTGEGKIRPAPQSRLTVAFRIFLAIPQLIVLWLLGVAAGVITIIGRRSIAMRRY